jgi:tetratricopeptide (TPR) repeat protein
LRKQILLELDEVESKNSHLLQVGIDLEKRGKHEEALRCFNEVLTKHFDALDFEVALSLFFKGCILEKLTNIDGMISCYLHLIKMDLEEQDMETIIYIYENTLNEAVPKQIRFLSSDIPTKRAHCACD